MRTAHAADGSNSQLGSGRNGSLTSPVALATSRSCRPSATVSSFVEARRPVLPIWYVEKNDSTMTVSIGVPKTTAANFLSTKGMLLSPSFDL